MQHESIFAPRPRNGQIYWIRLAARQHIAWLRYGPLLVLLLLLLEVPDAFGVLYQADAPARVLNQATLLVIALGGWMLLVDLVYRLAERERHMLLNYLIAWGIAIGLALFNRVLGVLLDDWLDPGGRQYAFQSFCALLLSVITAPLALKLLLHEPLIERLALAYKGPSRWPWVERRLRHYLKHHPDALAPTLLLAEGLLIQGWHEEALVLLKHLTVRHPRAWESWAALGAVALENDRWEQAVSSLSSAIRLAPRAAQGPLHFTLGLALLGNDQLENGYHELDRASRWPLPPHLRHYRWFMLMRLGQVWGAPDLMYRATNAVKNTPRDAWAFLEWYESLDRADLPTLGEDLYEAADWTRRLLNIRRVI